MPPYPRAAEMAAPGVTASPSSYPPYMSSLPSQCSFPLFCSFGSIVCRGRWSHEVKERCNQGGPRAARICSVFVPAGGPLWCGPGQNSDAAWGIDPSRSSRGLPPTWLYGVMAVMRQSLVPCVVGPGSDLLESYPGMARRILCQHTIGAFGYLRVLGSLKIWPRFCHPLSPRSL